MSAACLCMVLWRSHDKRYHEVTKPFLASAMLGQCVQEELTLGTDVFDDIAASCPESARKERTWPVRLEGPLVLRREPMKRCHHTWDACNVEGPSSNTSQAAMLVHRFPPELVCKMKSSGSRGTKWKSEKKKKIGKINSDIVLLKIAPDIFQSSLE